MTSGTITTDHKHEQCTEDHKETSRAYGEPATWSKPHCVECGEIIPCPHPKITVQLVRDAFDLAARLWDSSPTCIACPDCLWKGYPTINDNDDTIDFLDEPRGTGR